MLDLSKSTSNIFSGVVAIGYKTMFVRDSVGEMLGLFGNSLFNWNWNFFAESVKKES